MVLFRRYAIEHFWLPSIVLLLLVGSIFAIIVGVGLIVRSEATFRLFGAMNRWVSTRAMLKPVDEPWNLEQTLHRQRNLLGAAFVFGAVISIGVLVWKFDVNAIASAFNGKLPAVQLELIAASLKWLLLVGDAVAIVVGAALILFPAALARIETRMNRWYSPRSIGKDMDLMHLGIDQWTKAHPRAIGWIIVLLAVFVVLNLGVVVFGRY